MGFRELPTHPQTQDDKQQWADWVQSATPGELFEAFLCRMNHLSRVSPGDLEPVQALLAGRLQEQLQGGPA